MFVQITLVLLLLLLSSSLCYKNDKNVFTYDWILSLLVP